MSRFMGRHRNIPWPFELYVAPGAWTIFITLIKLNCVFVYVCGIFCKQNDPTSEIYIIIFFFFLKCPCDEKSVVYCDKMYMLCCQVLCREPKKYKKHFSGVAPIARSSRAHEKFQKIKLDTVSSRSRTSNVFSGCPKRIAGRLGSAD